MGGVDREDFQVPGGEFGDAAFHLDSYVVGRDVRQFGQIDGLLRVGDESGVFEPGEFRQTAGDIAGAAVEISGQLGHFGQRPAQGLLRVRGRAGGPDDLAFGRKGRRIVGQDTDCRNAHFKRKIGSIQLDSGLAVLVEHLLDQ